MRPVEGTITDPVFEKAVMTGMIPLPLSRDAEEYGRRLKRRYDQKGVRDAFKSNGADKRWTGHAVEYELHQWFEREQIPHHWYDDGAVSKVSEDFALGDPPELKLAVKANSGDAPRGDFVFIVQEHHARKLGHGVLFCIVQVRSRRIWVAGYMDAEKFRGRADRFRKGEIIPHLGRPAEYGCRTIRADALEPAHRFIQMIRRTM